MARMIGLKPIPQVSLEGEWEMLAVEAGRYGDGLRVSVHLHNGILQYADTVRLAHAQSREKLANMLGKTSGLSSAIVEPKLLELLDSCEGVLRHMEEAENAWQVEMEDGKKLSLHDPEPWDEPVDGAALLRTLQGVIKRFLVLPSGASYAVSLWVLHTHALDAASVTPILHLSSPQPRCGKSTLLSLLQALCRHALLASNISTASVYRAVEKWTPTLLIDEADTFLKANEELRGIINSGHSRWTAHVLRCEADSHEPQLFSTWAPKALAGIGTVAPTLQDRAIEIPMRRKLKEETVERFRLDHMAQFENIKRQCIRWSIDNQGAIQAADPTLPDYLDDRAADNWRTLCAIAQVAGEESLVRAHQAIKALHGNRDDEDQSAGIMLISDIRDIFDTRPHGRITSENLISILHDIEERPWGEWGRSRKPISKIQVARLLKPFGIRPREVRDGSGKGKGYRLEDCQDSFFRYLPPISSATPRQPSNDAEISDFQNATSESHVADEKTRKSPPTLDCRGVAGQKGVSGGKNKSDSEKSPPGYAQAAIHPSL